ncbi:MAG: large-conductance mechanosensitive channel protein MscL [Ruminococcus sp.]|nr:large-conductance mechanosensitive channel protein MscL [Ruminococcus sp.]MCM1382539.1 large-conductance mechanosensitive channel protein MscL [Muribaculaceae bacterium]MCM1478053.1 large-conductance mechanosensitive channel protein MscL [Muribaculaceae bacterium]
MIAEFKEFISKGNVVDMAVGVIIGSAFTAIVNSLVADIFTPIIGIIIGGIDFASLSFKIPDTEIDGKVITQGAELTYGNFIQSIITFLLTAACVFIFVKVINAVRNGAFLKKKKAEEEAKAEEPAPQPPKPTQEELLAEIRDLLAKQYSDVPENKE